jgi:hypothetical protein
MTCRSSSCSGPNTACLGMNVESKHHRLLANSHNVRGFFCLNVTLQDMGSVARSHKNGISMNNDPRQEDLCHGTPLTRMSSDGLRTEAGCSPIAIGHHFLEWEHLFQGIPLSSFSEVERVHLSLEVLPPHNLVSPHHLQIW